MCDDSWLFAVWLCVVAALSCFSLRVFRLHFLCNIPKLSKPWAEFVETFQRGSRSSLSIAGGEQRVTLSPLALSTALSKVHKSKKMTKKIKRGENFPFQSWCYLPNYVLLLCSAVSSLSGSWCSASFHFFRDVWVTNCLWHFFFLVAGFLKGKVSHWDQPQCFFLI